MIVGDMNISCSTIDHCDPGDENVNNISLSFYFLSFCLLFLMYETYPYFLIDVAPKTVILSIFYFKFSKKKKIF